MGKQKDEIIYNIGCPDWMLTFGDCMSLLLCFFVMLMIFSTPDESKLMEVLGGLQGALGVIEPVIGDARKLSMTKQVGLGFDGDVAHGVKEQYSVDHANQSPVKLRELRVKNKYSQFKESLKNLGFKNIVSTQQLEEGIMVKVAFRDLFSPGGDILKAGTSKWLEGFAGLAGSVGNEIRMTACFNPEDPMESSLEQMREAGVMSLFRQRLDVLFFAMSKRYDIPSNRIGLSFQFIPLGEEPYLSVLLAESYGTSEVSMSELIRQDGL